MAAVAEAEATAAGPAAGVLGSSQPQLFCGCACAPCLMTLHGSTGVDLIRRKVRTMVLGSLNVAEAAGQYKLRHGRLLHMGDLPMQEGAQGLWDRMEARTCPCLQSQRAVAPAVGAQQPARLLRCRIRVQVCRKAKQQCL